MIEFGEAVERFRELLHQSVERQLVADVPVGVFLSGGLDSSSIVATATKIQPGIKSFSFGFDGVEASCLLPRPLPNATIHITLN